jgi:hypothetical protein
MRLLPAVVGGNAVKLIELAWIVSRMYHHRPSSFKTFIKYPLYHRNYSCKMPFKNPHHDVVGLVIIWV